MPDTRISAQTRPSTVDSSSEPIVTMIVSATPLIRIGRNSTASRQKACIRSPCAFRPHLSRIFSTVPFAFSFASEVLILASNSVSPLRTPMPTEPTVAGL